MNSRYEIIIYWSEPDECFVAEVPELPGCMAHGESYIQALQMVQEAIDLWLDVAFEECRIIPEPKGRLMYA